MGLACGKVSSLHSTLASSGECDSPVPPSSTVAKCGAPQRVEERAGLPAGWEAAWSTAHKRWYYFNRTSSERTWERPAARCAASVRVATKSGNGSVPLASQPVKDGLPPGWQSAWDPTSQKCYYFNTATLESSWQRPVEGRFKTTADPAFSTAQASRSSPSVQRPMLASQRAPVADRQAYVPGCSNVKFLYHATSLAKANQILREAWFKAGKKGFLGAGIYFSEEKAHALRYCQPRGHTKVTIRIEVDLGKVKVVPRGTWTAQELQEDGCDSYQEAGRDCIMLPEIRNHQINFSKACIEY